MNNLAGAIAATQSAEIRTMKEMLQERGADAGRVEPPPYRPEIEPATGRYVSRTFVE